MSLQHRFKVYTLRSMPSPEPMSYGYMLSPLWYMARFGLDELVSMLLKNGADVKDALFCQASARTPKDDVLMRVMRKAYEAIGNLLIQQEMLDCLSFEMKTIGLDLESDSYHEFYSENGDVLLAAIHSGSYKCVDLLLEAGASVATNSDIETKEAEVGSSLDMQMACWTKGTSPVRILQAAVLSGSLDIIEQILEAGANVNAPGGEDGNALYTAIRWQGDPEIIQMLLNYGANVEAEGTYYGSPLQAAAARPSLKVTELLLRAGANVNAKGSSYGSALLAAIQNYAYEESHRVITALLDAGAEVNSCDPEGPPLHVALEQYACNEVDEDTISLLINRGADLHQRSAEGSTALGVALYAGCDVLAIEMLLSAGSSVEKVEKSGLSAWEIALEEEHSNLDDVLIFLAKHGAGPITPSQMT